MNDNEQLQQLREKVSRKQNLEQKLRELRSQREKLDDQVRELKKIMWDEQADVERLAHVSLASVFYAMVGKKTEKLDKEKVEAYAAKVKYDSAEVELNLVEEDIRRVETQLREISGFEKQYEVLLQEKSAKIKESASAEAERLLQIEGDITVHKSQKKEINEAISAGSSALASTDSILSSLDSAKGWGTWDLIGGGLVSDMIKHSYLDEAQHEVQQLQSQLRRFKTELADVMIYADLQVNIDGFLRFADYFFDGLFADWAVMEKISQSKDSVEKTKSEIQAVLSQLRRLETAVDQKIAKLEAEKASVLANVVL